MNRQGIIYVRFLLCAAMVSGMVAWGNVNPEEKNPVKAVFTYISLEKDRIWVNGQLQESSLHLEFVVNFTVKEPWGFATQHNNRIQYLEATDSTGRKLAPVEFRIGSMYPRSEHGMVRASVNGVAGELPSPAASWIRLKGVFRVPLSRSMKSLVYELPLEKGAEMNTPLPGNEGREDMGGEDIALPEHVPTGRFFLEECKSFEKEGKKMIEVVVGLAVESAFDLESFEIVNEKEEPLKTDSRGEGSSIGSSSQEWTKLLQFEAPDHLQKLRFRMVYKVPLEPVAVPVDVKVGMRGEIRDKKK